MAAPYMRAPFGAMSTSTPRFDISYTVPKPITPWPRIDSTQLSDKARSAHMEISEAVQGRRL